MDNATGTDVAIKDESIDDIQAWPKITDDDSIHKGCDFLSTYSMPEKKFANREQYYAWLRLMVELSDGVQRVHHVMKSKKGYNFDAINADLELSIAKSGPRTCKDISTRWADCSGCKYYGQVSCPLQIKPDHYIETEETGFWVMGNNKGHVYPKKPCFPDLVKYFEKANKCISRIDTSVIYRWEDSHWKPIHTQRLKGFAQTNMDPKPNKNQRSEFLDLMNITNMKDSSWFSESTSGLINLQNGVYSVSNNSLTSHSTEHGFTYILPYYYDGEADCPRFKKFLSEVCVDRQELIDNIVEFIGYAISNAPCKTEKAMIMFGGGSNGKSTLINVLKKLVGKDNYSSLTLTALNKDTKRYLVEGKLFNLGDESSVHSLGESEVFKTMVTGGDIDVKRLYSQDYTIESKCKLIIACNELPKSGDRSDGLYRRMLLIPFDAKFSGDLGNIDRDIEKKLFAELPGIFNLAVEGYKRLVKNSWEFTPSDISKQALVNYQTENDNVIEWKGERLKVWAASNPNFEVIKTPSRLLYGDYKEWCNEYSNYTLSNVMFTKRLKASMGSDNFVMTRTAWSPNKHTIPTRERCVKGVVIDPNKED